jgi:hypothetical protein
MVAAALRATCNFCCLVPRAEMWSRKAYSYSAGDCRRGGCRSALAELHEQRSELAASAPAPVRLLLLPLPHAWQA